MTPEPPGDSHVPERRDRGEAQGPRKYEEIVEFWAGPMPDPETLREFNRAVPGAGDLIVREFREQGQHRRAIEQRESKAYAFGTRVTAVVPPLVDALLIVGGLGSILTGRVVVGATLVILEMLLVFIIRMSYRPAVVPSALPPATEQPDPENSDSAD